MNRGDVVLVPFPFQDKPGEKIRPAVVIQSDICNQRHANTILAMVTGNLDAAGESANVLVDPSAPEGLGAGLKGRSLIKCCNVTTIRKNRILHVIGKLTDTLIDKVDFALKEAFGLS